MIFRYQHVLVIDWCVFMRLFSKNDGNKSLPYNNDESFWNWKSFSVRRQNKHIELLRSPKNINQKFASLIHKVYPSACLNLNVFFLWLKYKKCRTVDEKNCERWKTLQVKRDLKWFFDSKHQTFDKFESMGSDDRK